MLTWKTRLRYSCERASERYPNRVCLKGPNGDPAHFEAFAAIHRIKRVLCQRLHQPNEPNEPCLYRKLVGARFQLYRRRFLQVNTRWKALDEIYSICMRLHRSDLNISADCVEKVGGLRLRALLEQRRLARAHRRVPLRLVLEGQRPDARLRRRMIKNKLSVTDD